jgi:hypothetical protein
MLVADASIRRVPGDSVEVATWEADIEDIQQNAS